MNEGSDFRQSVIARLQALGFRVECGDPDDGTLAGRWWWTLCRDGWSGIETQQDESASADEAWLSALEFACNEAALSLDALLNSVAVVTAEPQVARAAEQCAG